MVGLCLLMTPHAVAQTAQVDDVVRNVADVTFQINGAQRSFQTNPAEFTIEQPPADPTIEFFRHTVAAPNPILRQINGSDFVPSGGNGSLSSLANGDPSLFVATPPALAANG